MEYYKSHVLENTLDFYDYLWELKYKLQIERMICNGTNNDEQFSKFLFSVNANELCIQFCFKFRPRMSSSKLIGCCVQYLRLFLSC